MAFASLIDQVNRAVAKVCGDKGTYRSFATGATVADVDIVLGTATDELDERSTREVRSVAEIPEEQIPVPIKSDRIDYMGQTYLIDDIAYDEGMWMLTLRREIT